MFIRALILTMFYTTANASPAEAPEVETPPAVSPEVQAWRDKPPARDYRYIPAPIVKPLPVDQIVKNRLPDSFPFEWHPERGWIDRRK